MPRVPLRGKPLQHGIIDLARTLGWRCAHFPSVKTEFGWRTPVAGDGKGFPDLLLVRDRVIAAEVKGDGDSLKPHQDAWLAAFRMAGVEAYVWTPKSWEAGSVEEILRARRLGPQTPFYAVENDVIVGIVRDSKLVDIPLADGRAD